MSLGVPADGPIGKSAAMRREASTPNFGVAARCATPPALTGPLPEPITPKLVAGSVRSLRDLESVTDWVSDRRLVISIRIHRRRFRAPR